MTGIVISVFVFLAVFLGIFAVNLILTDIFKQDRSRQLKEMEAELRLQMRQHAQARSELGDLQSIVVAAQPHNPFSVVQLIKKLKKAADQAGTKTDPQMIGFFGLVGGAAAGLVLYFLTHVVLYAFIAVFLGGLFPIFYILRKRKQRLMLMSEQFPDALELMSRVMRSGQTVTQALNAVADEFKDPIGTEFGLCYEQQNLGLSLDVALHSLIERTGLMEIKIMVMGMIIQRQAGGNLAELLDKLSSVMRQRLELKGIIRTFTAEGRMQAAFLVALPFFAWIGLFFINRVYALKLLDHSALIYVTLGLMLTGMLWIRKIINFDY
jgi:tight adherence protein B